MSHSPHVRPAGKSFRSGKSFHEHHRGSVQNRPNCLLCGCQKALICVSRPGGGRGIANWLPLHRVSRSVDAFLIRESRSWWSQDFGLTFDIMPVPSAPPRDICKGLQETTIGGCEYVPLDSAGRKRAFLKRNYGKVWTHDMTATFRCSCGNTWSSSKALLVVVRPNTDVYHAAVFKQDCHLCNRKGFINFVAKKEVRRVMDKLTSAPNVPKQRRVGGKSARHTRCDACRAGYHQSTITGVVSVDKDGGTSVRVDRATASERRERMNDESNWRILYHQTDRNAAEQILTSQKFRRGITGALGGGIYFAESAEATNLKAKSRGVVLEALVFLGNIKTIHRRTDTICFRDLVKENYDSVCGDFFHSGNEYIVYNYDQVREIKRVRA